MALRFTFAGAETGGIAFPWNVRPPAQYAVLPSSFDQPECFCMKTSGSKSTSPSSRLPKCPTGIQGLDEITDGGLPRGRPTLICGGAGCGKTLFAAEFLVRGAAQFGEPGVFMSFEETDAELKANVASLGFDLADLVRRKKLVLDYVYIEPSEVQE